MKYILAEIDFICEKKIMQTVNDLMIDSMGEIGFESFEEKENGLKGYIQEDNFSEKILKECIQNFFIPNIKITYKISKCEDKNWNTKWEESGFEDIIIEDKLLIYDAAHYLNIKNSPYKIKIGIDTKQAFGTGTHPTTQMILEYMLKFDLKNKSILDCGCGTGILGIAASKLGAKQIIAYDIDEWSVRNTKRNATINEVSNIQTLRGDSKIIDTLNTQVDILFANINRNILLNDMEKFSNILKNDGKMILSGFYESDIPYLQKKGRSLNLKLVATKLKDEWASIVFKKH